MNRETFILQTKEHIAKVELIINAFNNLLRQRGAMHDNTKFMLCNAYVRYLNNRDSGKVVDDDTYARHVAMERHHLHKRIPDKPNLIDLVEMMADWIDASTRKGKILDPSKVVLPELPYEEMVRNTFELLISQVFTNYFPTKGECR